MRETFYTVLGVPDDAGADAVRRAYRERVKDRHPDVADDPSGPRDFKRLTTARDVLLDETERARYDELGHDAYVSRHVGTDVWTAESERVNSSRPNREGHASGSTARGTPEGSGRSPDRVAWLGNDWEGPKAPRRPHYGATASTATESWQTASEAYRSRPSRDVPDPGTVARLRGLLQAVGLWPAVYVALVASALATAWFTWAEVGATSAPSIPGLALGLVALGVAVVLSALHVVSLLYT